MTIETTIINTCNDCEFKSRFNDGQATLTECIHLDAPKGYDAIIDEYDRLHLVAKFCPLKEKELERHQIFKLSDRTKKTVRYVKEQLGE